MQERHAPIRIGSRGSDLALAQANIVKSAIQTRYPNRECQIHIINTQGDIDKSVPLSELGGKGVFIKEIEIALDKNEIDIAVHSLKDVTTAPNDTLSICGYLKAESIADCVVLKAGKVDTLPQNIKLGTGSLRRKALLKQLRPDITVVPIRGNVESRIQKIQSDSLDGVILSEAGLIRLNRQSDCHYRFDPNTFLPAPGQGVIALQTRKSDTKMQAICQSISDPKQKQISSLELALLEALNFNCDIPLGSVTKVEDNRVDMTVFLADKTLKKPFQKHYTFDIDTAQKSIQSIAKDCQTFWEASQ